MHEYEFRLVVESRSSFLPLIQSFPIRQCRILYIKPHFRYRDKKLETKCIESTRAVYHDGLWFRWVHSIEKAYRYWSRSTCLEFLHNIGNYQAPFSVEARYVVDLDSQAQLYTFQKDVQTFRCVFEWEYGLFKKPVTRLDYDALLGTLSKYRSIYQLLKEYPAPSYQLNEALTRRPVTCVGTIPVGPEYLYAHKLDGIFGLVYSYADRVKEKWEGYECVVRKGVTLGDGLVFSAERMEGGPVYLLDVYHVRGHDTADWCKRAILTEFLPQLPLLDGYRVQTYAPSREASKPSMKTDGLIIHNVMDNTIFKSKSTHSIDLVYYKHYFYMPNGRIKCEEELEDGCVYEISTADGKVMRKRCDRFKGNSSAQLDTILKHGWCGPPIEPLPVVDKKQNRKRKHN